MARMMQLTFIVCWQIRKCERKRAALHYYAKALFVNKEVSGFQMKPLVSHMNVCMQRLHVSTRLESI